MNYRKSTADHKFLVASDGKHLRVMVERLVQIEKICNIEINKIKVMKINKNPVSLIEQKHSCRK